MGGLGLAVVHYLYKCLGSSKTGMKYEIIRPTTGVTGNSGKSTNKKGWRLVQDETQIQVDALQLKEITRYNATCAEEEYIKNQSQKKKPVAHTSTSYGLDAQLLGVPMTMAILGVHDLRGLCGTVDQSLIRA